jgi:hypothetical protein
MMMTNSLLQKRLSVLSFPDSNGYFINQLVRIEPATFNGTAPFTYSLTGTLPTGLSFDTTTGFITGTPTVAGTSGNLKIQVTDAASVQASTGNFNILTVDNADVDAVHLVLGGMPDRLVYTVGDLMQFTVSATGGTPPYYFNLTGADGVTEFPVIEDHRTGVIAVERDNGDGTFSEFVSFSVSGIYRIQVIVADFVGLVDYSEFEIVVLPDGASGSGSSIDGKGLSPTFGESFDSSLSIYDSIAKVGRWKTNYPFGNDGDPNPDDSSSRNFAR